MNRQAIILSGGQGTRARNRIGNIPKSLIQINKKPLLWYQIELLKKHNFNQVLILVHHLGDQIIDYIDSNLDWGIDIQIIKEETPMGTAGAVINCIPMLEDDFLIIYGDTMLDVDLSNFERFHQLDKNSDVTLFVHPNDHPFDSDLLEMNEEGVVIAFHNCPHKENAFYANSVNAALYYLKKSCLLHWADGKHKLDFARDVFPFLLENNFVIKGYNSSEYIKDCGTPERIDKINHHLKSGYIQDCSLKEKQPCIFLDRDGTLNREVNHLKTHVDFELLPNVVDAIKKINQSKYISIVITNQPVIARGECTSEALRVIHNKMETQLGSKGAYLDRIYYCPHYPLSGFEGEIKELKIECDCRKPNTGMIAAAATDFNIDHDASWFIGDSTVDIMLAKNAGFRSILVETGYAGLDGRYEVLPDFTLPDLNSAIDFILSKDTFTEEIYKKHLDNIRSGDFIFIGGLSRIGKTNFSNALKYNLLKKGQNVIVLSLDRWLLDANMRGKGVLKRYATKEIEALIKLLSDRPNEIFVDVPIYNKITRKRSIKSSKIGIKNSDIIIFEGTIALCMLDVISNRNKVSCYLELDEDIRCQRFFKEYKLRGYQSKQIETLYNERVSDEHPIIKQSAKKADLSITIKTNF